eukprot:TRINITY_DN9952_c0_g1_i1.p1 TRINITY_DN9952_c0_g1~~TRINITY_DN9952_c0_g1_i1.p1  ORF type:complete len:139 (+),score=32.03 TRINITY_DN9952_c0_g1_i1:43-459(+)
MQTEAPEVDFLSAEEAIQKANALVDRLAFCFLGVSWWSPSVSSQNSVAKVAAAPKFHHTGFFFIDQEKSWEFCDEHQIVVGNPAVMVYWRGQPLIFRLRGDVESVHYAGPINEAGVELILKEAEAARFKKRFEINLSL